MVWVDVQDSSSSVTAGERLAYYAGLHLSHKCCCCSIHRLLQLLLRLLNARPNARQPLPNHASHLCTPPHSPPPPSNTHPIEVETSKHTSGSSHPAARCSAAAPQFSPMLFPALMRATRTCHLSRCSRPLPVHPHTCPRPACCMPLCWCCTDCLRHRSRPRHPFCRCVLLVRVLCVGGCGGKSKDTQQTGGYERRMGCCDLLRVLLSTTSTQRRCDHGTTAAATATAAAAAQCQCC